VRAGCLQRASKRFGPGRSEGFKAEGESRAALLCQGLLRDELPKSKQWPCRSADTITFPLAS
jgi:hypothetical protein